MIEMFFEGQLVKLSDSDLSKYLGAEQFRVLKVVGICNCTPRWATEEELGGIQGVGVEVHGAECPCSDIWRHPHPQNVYIASYGKTFPLSGRCFEPATG